jgi:RNA polymerase sigma factor (TIGR02999 family)
MREFSENNDTSRRIMGAVADGAEHRGEGDVTRLLRMAHAGDREALDQIFPLVYRELRRVAQRQLRRERADHTLGVSGLVNEVYLKLADQVQVDLQSRDHFYAVAARAMRQILIDYARRRQAKKRGASRERTTLEGKPLGFESPLEDLVALGEALDRLAQFDDRMRRIVEYRFFCGLSEQETAEVLGVTVRTVQREWVKARAWLYQQLYPTSGDRH